MITLFDSRSKIISLILTFFTVIVAMIFVSYQVVYKFACNADSVYYGRSQAALARELREEIMKRPDCEAVAFTNDINQTLRGFLFKRPGAVATALLCHGYKGSKEFMYGFIDLLPDFNLMIFDFRASGESDGTLISMGFHEYKDVVAASQFLKSNTPANLPFVILGFSMGGCATLRAAASNPNLADAYIVDSSFSALREMFLQRYSKDISLPFYPFFPLIQTMFHFVVNCNINEVNSMTATATITQPIMFVHSCSDTFIPPDQSIKLYACAQNEKSKIWIGPHARHGQLHSNFPHLYSKKIKSFLKKAINLNSKNIIAP